MNFKALNNSDPLVRNVIKDNSVKEMSPMMPPEAFAPSTVKAVPYDDMHPLLQELMDEHATFITILNDFESALLNWKQNKWIFNNSINSKFKKLFFFIDNHLPEHNKKEEKILFPVLHRKLLESGEHSKENNPVTGVDVMEYEHIQVAQLSALCLNFLGLGSRLRDEISRHITFEFAYNQGMEIVETMRLHIYRENVTLFPLAMNLISRTEFSEIYSALTRIL